MATEQTQPKRQEPQEQVTFEFEIDVDAEDDDRVSASSGSDEDAAAVAAASVMAEYQQQRIGGYVPPVPQFSAQQFVSTSQLMPQQHPYQMLGRDASVIDKQAALKLQGHFHPTIISALYDYVFNSCSLKNTAFVHKIKPALVENAAVVLKQQLGLYAIEDLRRYFGTSERDILPKQSLIHTMAAIKERGDRNQQTRAAAMMSDAAPVESEETGEQQSTAKQPRQPAPPSMMTLGVKRQALKLADSAFIGFPPTYIHALYDRVFNNHSVSSAAFKHGLKNDQLRQFQDAAMRQVLGKVVPLKDFREFYGISEIAAPNFAGSGAGRQSKTPGGGENQFASESSETGGNSSLEKSKQDRDREEQETSLRAYLEDFLGVVAPAPQTAQIETEPSGATASAIDDENDFDDRGDEIDSNESPEHSMMLGREPGEILDKPSSSASPKKPILIQAELKGKRGRVTIQVTQGGPDEKKQRMVLMRSEQRTEAEEERATAVGGPGGATGGLEAAGRDLGGTTRSPGSVAGGPGSAAGGPGSGTRSPGSATGGPGGATQSPGSAAGGPGFATGGLSAAEESDRYSLRKRKA